MPVSITVAPSPKRQKQLKVPESQYLVALAAQIAEDHPHATVLARYGHHDDDLMVIRPQDADDVELF
jgi:hypothetical protein